MIECFDKAKSVNQTSIAICLPWKIKQYFIKSNQLASSKTTATTIKTIKRVINQYLKKKIKIKTKTNSKYLNPPPKTLTTIFIEAKINIMKAKYV